MMEKFEFYLVWESGCRNFIDEEITFTPPDLRDSFEIHVFLRRDNPQEATPPLQDYIYHHQSLTTSPFASKTTLQSYLHRLYGSSVENSKVADKNIFLVGEYDREFEELHAILKINNAYLDISEVDGKQTTLLETLENLGRACRFCKIIFSDEEETDDHNFINHDFFCNNSFCERYTKRFYLEKDLHEHLTAQEHCAECPTDNERVFCDALDKKSHMEDVHGVPLIVEPKPLTPAIRLSDSTRNEMTGGRSGGHGCAFCPQKIFRNHQQKESHMKFSHKKCNCGCGEYFENRDTYIAHFYTVYPLPCYEVRKCPQRFQSLYYQARHHEQKHFSDHPYCCVACKENEEVKNARKVSFKDIRGLRNHGREYGHTEAEMFLEDFSALAKGLGVKMAPERACSVVNYW